MYSIMCHRGDVGIFKSFIGSNNFFKDKYVQDDLTVTTESKMDSYTPSALDYIGGDFTQSLDDPLQVDIGLNGFVANVTHARHRENITAKHLRKNVALTMIQQREHSLLLHKNVVGLTNQS